MRYGDAIKEVATMHEVLVLRCSEGDEKAHEVMLLLLLLRHADTEPLIGAVGKRLNNYGWVVVVRRVRWAAGCREIANVAGVLPISPPPPPSTTNPHHFEHSHAPPPRHLFT
jgi:hypothetical protein